jgi:sterol desaturase/sphingolipid hydroxylase (fatty acid hydroxylase superfamily)
MTTRTKSAKRRHNLARMNMRDLLGAFFRYAAVQTYLALGTFSVLAAWSWHQALAPLAIAALATIFVYPLVWYVLHRFVLHGQFLYRSPLTAAMWKRIHFDHHQDPNDLSVLFGALYTTLPTIAIVTIPIGHAIGGPAGAAAAFGTGLLTTCFYEFAHCVQHLNTQPRTEFMKTIKRLHLSHHFHDEKGNFGITNFIWDRVFGTHYSDLSERPRSATVFNIGYTDDMAKAYPWVNALSGGTRGDGNPRRFRDEIGSGANEPERLRF